MRKRELAIFQRLPVGVSGMWRGRLVLPDEWGAWGAGCWAAVLIPMLVSLKRPGDISFLPLERVLFSVRRRGLEACPDPGLLNEAGWVGSLNFQLSGSSLAVVGLQSLSVSRLWLW